MDIKENTVILSTSSYNQIKSENTKFNLFMDRLFEYAELSPDYCGLDFDTKLIGELIHLCYPDRYKKKLSYLRQAQTKLNKRKMEWEKESTNDSERLSNTTAGL